MPHAFLLHLSPSKPTPRHKNLHQYTQGLFYHLLERIDPELSAAVHAAKRNPFTLWAKEQREGVMLRVSVLDDALFQPLLRVVLEESLSGLELGQDSYRVARVLATPEGHPDAGYLSWQEILSAQPTNRLELHFLSPTVFATSKASKRLYTPLPQPDLLLKSLFESFQHFSPQPYSAAEKAALQEVFSTYTVISSHSIKTRLHLAGKQPLTGFVGTASLRYIEHAAQVMCALGRLKQLMFFSGVGAKTSYGMGQLR